MGGGAFKNAVAWLATPYYLFYVYMPGAVTVVVFVEVFVHPPRVAETDVTSPFLLLFSRVVACRCLFYKEPYPRLPD